MSTTKTLAVVAIEHQRAPLAILEQVNLDKDGCATLAHTLTTCAGVSEVVVLSTCNRTELYLAGDAPDPAEALAALVSQLGISQGVLDTYVRQASGANAALHLFRVAAGLESRVTGEREILGQVRSAITVARKAGTVGSHLDCMFRSAIALGRRAQQTDPETPSQLPQVGLDAARIDATQAAGLTVVMGAGQMAAATVRELVARGMDYVVCARRVERAAILASRPDQVVSFDDLHTVLDRAEVVVCATGARAPLLTMQDAQSTMARRRGRPLVIVDLSLPRNVDPAAGLIPGLRLLDLEDLVSGSSVLEHRRRTEIIDDEFQRFGSWLAGQTAGRMIAELHERVRADCRSALAAVLGEIGVSPATIDAATHSIAGRLLHAPTIAIKAAIADTDEDAANAILASFGISGWTRSTVVETAVTETSARTIRLVARSGQRRREIGRVHRRTASRSRIAS